MPGQSQDRWPRFLPTLSNKILAQYNLQLGLRVHPPEHGLKFFLRADLEPLRDDRGWIDEASDVILDYWKKTEP
jgi:hypothetical protein